MQASGRSTEKGHECSLTLSDSAARKPLTSSSGMHKLAAETPMLSKPITAEQLADALELAWDEFTADTGNVPDCFERRGRKWFVDFHKGPFAAYAAAHLNKPHPGRGSDA